MTGDGAGGTGGPGRASGPDAGRGRDLQGLPVLHVLLDDERARRDEIGRIAAGLLAAGGGEVALHLRLRRASGRTIHELAVAVREAADRHGGWCVVNDRADVALTAGAHAVQLGGRSLPVTAARRALDEATAVGRSVHGVGEARRAVRDGANYLVLGTIYPTPSHPDRSGAGPGLVEEVSGLGAPVVAIGGVNADRAGELRKAGASGMAVRRAVWDAPDPARAARGLLAAWSES